MGFPFNGDLVPTFSGFANLGVDVGTNGQNAFDFSSIAPFGHIHLNSGVFHHATSTGWESGVIRFNSAQSAFEVSVDGGITFGSVATTNNVVTSVGVLGDVDLTGDVDFATPASGFMVIEDSSDASPLLWSVDHLGLSGLWNFPTNGFDSIPECYTETFASALSWTVTHNLGTTGIIVNVHDGTQMLFPDKIEISDANEIVVSFNRAQAGTATVIGC
jgi:hypothetical protein